MPSDTTGHYFTSHLSANQILYALSQKTKALAGVVISIVIMTMRNVMALLKITLL